MEYVYYCDTTCQWMFNIPYPDRKGCFHEAFRTELEATDSANHLVFLKTMPFDLKWASEFMGLDDHVGASDHPAVGAAIGPADHPAHHHAVGAAIGPADHPAHHHAVGAAIGPADHPAHHHAVGAAIGPADHPAHHHAVGAADHPAVGAADHPAHHHAVGAAIGPAIGAAIGPADHHAVGAADHPAVGAPAVGAADHPAVGAPAGGLPDHHAVGAVIGGRKRKSKDFPKSRFQHVFWSKNQGKWNVRVKHPKTQKQMCATFVDEVEAARDADRKLFELYKIDNSLKPKLKFNFFKF